MTAKVLLVTDIFPNDWRNVIHKDQVDLYTLGGESVRQDFIGFWDIAKKCDLIVFPWEGFLIQKWFMKWKHLPEFRSFITSNSIKRVAWSMDSHHQWQLEQKLQKYFSTYYLAHSPYLEKFEQGKAAWLPCYWSFTDRQDLIKLTTLNYKKIYDFTAIYRDYWNIGDRTAASYECWKILQKNSYKVLFGQSDGQHFGKRYGERYIQALLSGKVVLNLSIMDDLNLRNFEAIGLNQVMVANRVVDHKKMNLDYSNTFFFDRYDMKSFEQAVEEAMVCANSHPQRTVDNVINHHMQVHRYVEMINREFSLNLEVPMIDVNQLLIENEGQIERKEQIFVFDPKQGDKEYLLPDLAIHAVDAYLTKKKFDKAYKSVVELIVDSDNELLNSRQDDFLYVLERAIHFANTDKNFYLHMIILNLLQVTYSNLQQSATAVQVEKMVQLVDMISEWSLPLLKEYINLLITYSIRVLENLLQEQKIREGYQFLQNVKKIAPNNGNVYYLEAKFLQMAGNYDQVKTALLCYLKNTDKRSDDPRWQSALQYVVMNIVKQCENITANEGLTYLEDILETLDYFEKIGVYGQAFYRSKAKVLHLLGRSAEAVQYYEKCVGAN